MCLFVLTIDGKGPLVRERWIQNFRFLCKNEVYFKLFLTLKNNNKHWMICMCNAYAYKFTMNIHLFTIVLKFYLKYSFILKNWSTQVKKFNALPKELGLRIECPYSALTRAFRCNSVFHKGITDLQISGSATMLTLS